MQEKQYNLSRPTNPENIGDKSCASVDKLITYISTSRIDLRGLICRRPENWYRLYRTKGGKPREV